MLSLTAALLISLSQGLNTAIAERALLNVSYDPTRELYQEYNEAFTKYWKKTKGQNVTVNQSHGGSGKQARSVIDGLEADVVTLALAYDIDVIAREAKLLPSDWQKRLQYNSTPYTSTIVFLVRKGNPKGVRDWEDLVRTGVSVITPNPKTSGGARWNYLAAWAFAMEKFKKDETKAKEFMSRLFQNVPLLDTGARGATVTFVERGIGDVLITWENEALLAAEKLGGGKLEIVTPSMSILTEPPVTWVDSVTAKHGTSELARAYLEYLYSEEGQRIVMKHHYRPRLESVAKDNSAALPPIRMVTINEMYGGWETAQRIHFSEGGVFDQIYAP